MNSGENNAIASSSTREEWGRLQTRTLNHVSGSLSSSSEQQTMTPPTSVLIWSHIRENHAHRVRHPKYHWLKCIGFPQQCFLLLLNNSEKRKAYNFELSAGQYRWEVSTDKHIKLCVQFYSSTVFFFLYTIPLIFNHLVVAYYFIMRFWSLFQNIFSTYSVEIYYMSLVSPNINSFINFMSKSTENLKPESCSIEDKKKTPRYF